MDKYGEKEWQPGLADNPTEGLWSKRNTPSFPKVKWLLRRQWKVKREN